MDTGNGYFEQVMATDEEREAFCRQAYPKFKGTEPHITALQKLANSHPNHGGVFREGEEIAIRGSRFRIEQIRPRGMVLILLPKQGNMCDQSGSNDGTE